MKREDRFTTKNDFFYAFVIVATFVVSTFGVGAVVVVNAGTVPVVAAVVRAAFVAAATYFASG